MDEPSRLILELRRAGWDDADICDLIVRLGTGEEAYLPGPG